MPRPVKFAGRLFIFSLLPLLLVFPMLAIGMTASPVAQEPAVDVEPADVDPELDARATVASYVVE